MKSKTKKSFLGALLVSSMFLATNNVDALTIKETTNTNDATLDKIAEGTILIGSTKFEPNVVLTALRASKATYNDVMLNLQNPNYTGVNIYYYLAGAWYQLDEANNVSVVDNETLLNELNNSDIYYINNNEKMLEVNYLKNIKEGYELVFETENPDRNKDVLYKEGIIYVPATIQTVEIFVKNIETGTKEKLDVISKADMNASEFNVVSSQGTIEKGDATGGDLNYVIDGNKITINGNLRWYGKNDNVQNGRKAGNYASVKISAPEIYSYEELLAKATIKIDDREIVDWGTVIDKSQGEDTYFVFYPRFDAETKTHTVTISWVDGNTQTFIIELGEEATLALPPQGTIEKGDATGGELNYATDGNKITINGKIKWYGSDANAQNGRKAGNYASVKISAPEGYTKEFLIANTRLVIDGKEVSWKDVIDETIGEDTYFVLYPRFDVNTKTHTVSINWEDGSIQEFVIELGEEATLALPPQGTIEKGDATGGELNYVTDGNKITINGKIKWYGSDANAQNGRKAGNYASVKISAPEGYTKEFLIANTRLVIDGKEVSWKDVIDETIGEDTYFVLYPRFDVNTKTHTVSINWEDGSIQEFVIELGEEATLEKAPSAKLEKGDATGGDLEYTIDGSNVTIDGNVLWYKSGPNQNGRKAGNYASVRISAPEGYTKEFLIANTKLVIDGKEVSWKDVIDETIGEDTYFVLYPRFDANTKTHTVEITWENGNTEIITISLSETATLESALQGTISLDETVGANIKSEFKDNTLTLDGTINYIKNKGNVFGYTITASEEYSNEELQNAKITINNYGKNGQITKVIDTTGATLFGTNNYFKVTNIATSNFGYDEIIITWENGNTQVIKVVFADTIVLEEKPNYVEKIELNFENASIVKGDTLTLEATIFPENATNKDIIWTSSNEEVAIVDENGVVTSLNYGTTIITAKTVDGEFVAECIVNVVYPEMIASIKTNETVSNVGNIFSKTVNYTFETTGGSEEYNYTFKIINTTTNEEVTDYIFDAKNNILTLTITDKTAAYQINYVIEDTAQNKVEGLLIIEAFEK